jgi:hypothetical protein
MPFISSVSGSKGGRIWPLSTGPVATAPTVTISSTTNFNQSIATFNGTVSANGAVTTTIKFQISSDNGTTWDDATGGTTISNTSSQSVSVYYNATGLSEGTVYKVRITATNSVGTSTTTATTGDFTTWSKQVYERTTSGGTTFTIPTVTPTGGSAVAVSIYDIIMFGGGGGGRFGTGGGGGSYVSSASIAMTGSRSITTSVGAGGQGAVTYVQDATAGGSSTLSGDLTTQTAPGGAIGDDTVNPKDTYRAGSSGNGNLGGTNTFYTVSKNNEYFAYGGGGGAGGAGGNATATSSSGTGGNGGTGVSITRGDVTRAGGAGGGGFGTTSSGGVGANNSYGSGGNGYNPGQAGYIRFRYYAASQLA